MRQTCIDQLLTELSQNFNNPCSYKWLATPSTINNETDNLDDAKYCEGTVLLHVMYINIDKWYIAHNRRSNVLHRLRSACVFI